MSEVYPPYSAGCSVCGSATGHFLDDGAKSLRACIDYLRSEIGTLQDEVRELRRQAAKWEAERAVARELIRAYEMAVDALRMQLAAKPPALITTYQQLAIATGSPVERLIAQGVFEPEPEPEMPVVQGHTVALEFRMQDLPRWQPQITDIPIDGLDEEESR